MKIQKMTTTACAALALGALALTTAGCDGQGVSGEEIAELTREVKEQQRLNTALMDRLDRMERTLNGHTEDIDLLSRQRVASELASADVAETAGGDAGEAAPAASAMGGDDAIAKLLETEDGQAAVEKAMAAIQERRDAERRERWVNSMVDRFATDANLTDVQTNDMRRVVGSSFKKMGDVWSGLRGNDLSAEERAMQREEAMVKMEEIRQETDEEVKAILTTDQYTIYEEQSARMRNWGRGGGGRRGR
jgi:hypothetical protein